jgi:LysR family transcriptional regulator, low CO2-responsive transcriptional regulator
VTPTQLRAFAAVVRLGSVKAAAGELGVTESAVSLLVAQLRKELDDQLFSRTSSGLAFTPGGLRLASRAAEILGLQDQTVREVSQAGQGHRLLRVAASAFFAEHAAPGLIQLFTSRANDLDVELSVRPPADFATLLVSREVDIAIGPQPSGLPESLTYKAFLNYEIVVVVGPGHPLAGHTPTATRLREQTWYLGPAAAEAEGAVPRMLKSLGIPEQKQRIFQSDAAALEETKRSNGVSVAVRFAVATEIGRGQLVRLNGAHLQSHGSWSAMTLPAASLLPAADELMRFITTPRATQAMIRGSGVTIGHFKPSVHVTLWS